MQHSTCLLTRLLVLHVMLLVMHRKRLANMDEFLNFENRFCILSTTSVIIFEFQLN